MSVCLFMWFDKLHNRQLEANEKTNKKEEEEEISIRHGNENIRKGHLHCLPFLTKT